MGKKRGSYKKKKPAKFTLPFKTTTPQGKKLYQRMLMRQRRGTPPKRFFKPGRPPKKFLVKDFEKVRKAKKLKVRG